MRGRAISCYATTAMRVWILFATVALAGCARPCPVEVPQVGADGGVAACVTSADCLRPTATLICGMTEDRLRDCIDCVERQCVRFVPEACP